MLLRKDFTFDAAHFLPAYQGKCENLHGHTFFLSVTIQGSPGPEGMIIDFAQFGKLVWDEIVTYLDHRNLNELFPVPSTENIAQWVYDKAEMLCHAHHLRLYEVMLSESSSSHIILRDNE
jgi:6-pyruvoyltetrahydropterin/6-carboxytetrahydropterin synthase